MSSGHRVMDSEIRRVERELAGHLRVCEPPDPPERRRAPSALAVTAIAAIVLILLSISGTLFLVVLATSLVWCLVIWAAFIR